MVTLGAVGDLAFTGAWREGAAPLAGALPALRRADLLFGNQESVLLSSEIPRGACNPGSLWCDERYADCLREAGFAVLNLAANHVLDCGWRGLLSSVGAVRRTGALALGAGEAAAAAQALQVVERGGLRFGFLGWVESNNLTHRGGGGRVAYAPSDPAEAAALVRRHRAAVDVLVVSLHADMEFQDVPSLPKAAYGRALADAGASLVLCHHPHVPQGVEERGGALIAWSLGNFVFPRIPYMEMSPHTDKGHLLLVDFDARGRLAGWRREHFRLTAPAGEPRPLTAEELPAVEAHYRRLDALVADPAAHRAAWLESCRSYLAQWWPHIVRPGGDRFIADIAWRLTLDEHRHWLAGVRELALEEAARTCAADFEFRRPNAPFESKRA